MKFLSSAYLAGRFLKSYMADESGNDSWVVSRFISDWHNKSERGGLAALFPVKNFTELSEIYTSPLSSFSVF